MDYVPYSSHFRDFINSQSHKEAVWEEWSRCERQLRDIVDTVLGEHFHNSNWMNEYKKHFTGEKFESIVKTFDEITKLRFKEKKKFDNDATLLEYTYPCHLQEIIAKLWDVFAKILDNDRNSWRKRFDFFQQIRAPLAHARMQIIGDKDKALLIIYVKDVESVYKKVCLDHP